MEPYYRADSGPDEGHLLELAVNLSPALELEETVVFGALAHLQQNALEKLQARECLKAEGKVVLKVRLTKNIWPADGDDAGKTKKKTLVRSGWKS